MSKKKRITIEVKSQIEVPADLYDDMTNEEIEKIELEGWVEWISDNVVSEKIIVEDI